MSEPTPTTTASPSNHARPAIPVVVMRGDGIGPEVTGATRRILDVATQGRLEWIEAEAGARVFATGDRSGVPTETREALRAAGVAIKGPLETPIGTGAKSANVTLRKLFGLYGNVRPARTLPGITGPFADRALDLLVVRENIEDLYAGIEHLQANGVAQALKVMTRPGCERIVRLAFELARAQGRRRVDVVTKANILKLTEGLLLEVFREIAPEYPELEVGELLVDNCAHQLVVRPERLDVLICSNLHGDIISDLTSGLVGGLGVAPSVNLGDDLAVFEPVHGSAPDIAGQDLANPTAAVLAGAMLCEHLGLDDAAAAVRAALGATLGAGIRTRDLAGADGVGCAAFTEAVLERLVPPVQEVEAGPTAVSASMPIRAVGSRAAVVREDCGIDVFVEYDGATAALAEELSACAAAVGGAFRLGLLAELGTKVWPDGPEAVSGVVCARFHGPDGRPFAPAAAALLAAIGARLTWVHVERLARFDGERGYTLAQGES